MDAPFAANRAATDYDDLGGVQNVLDVGDGSGDHHEFAILNCTANKALVGKDQDGINAPITWAAYQAQAIKPIFAALPRLLTCPRIMRYAVEFI